MSNTLIYNAFISFSVAALFLSGCGSDKNVEKTSSATEKSAPKKVAESVETQAATPAVTVKAPDGKKLFGRCKACHTLEQGGSNKVGPNLWGVFGKPAGTLTDFKYSEALKNSGVVWTDETMDGYIANPRKYIPKNRMTYAGLRKEADRAALIAYLRENTGAE